MATRSAGGRSRPVLSRSLCKFSLLTYLVISILYPKLFLGETSLAASKPLNSPKHLLLQWLCCSRSFDMLLVAILKEGMGSWCDRFILPSWQGLAGNKPLLLEAVGASLQKEVCHYTARCCLCSWLLFLCGVMWWDSPDVWDCLKALIIVGL